MGSSIDEYSSIEGYDQGAPPDDCKQEVPQFLVNKHSSINPICLIIKMTKTNQIIILISNQSKEMPIRLIKKNTIINHPNTLSAMVIEIQKRNFICKLRIRIITQWHI